MATNKRKNLSKYFEVLPEKADKWRNYAICTGCVKVVSREYAIEKRFSNKTEQILNHLKKCDNFKTWFPKDEVDEVLEVNEDKEIYKNQVLVPINNKRPHEQKFTSSKFFFFFVSYYFMNKKINCFK